MLLPVCGVDNPATVQLLLDNVPRLRHSAVSRLVVVLQPVVHVGLDAGVEVVLQDERGDGGSELGEEDQ